MDLRSLEELERAFKALANINRLKLLLALQRPKGYSEIELTPSRAGGGASKNRPISRQAVRNHIEELRELGVVTETDDDDRKRRFVVDRARLYAIIEQMRQLATVKPTVDPEGPTMALGETSPPPTPTDPHLALVRGVEEGRTFVLNGTDEPSEEGQTFVIGRDTSADVPLDYDAFVSGEHAYVHRREDGYFIEDLPQNKNGTFLNWRKVEDGGLAPLSPGDIVGVGLSLLVFRR